MALDVAIPADRNFTQNEAEKKLKYIGLCTKTMKAEHEMHNYNGKYCNHRSGNKGFKKCLKPYQENIRFTTKRQLHLQHQTQYGKYCSLKLEA